MKNCAVILAGGEGKNEIRQTKNIVGGARQTDALLGYVSFKESWY